MAGAIFGGRNSIARDESMCRVSQVFYELSSTLCKSGKSVLADLRYVSFEALSEDTWSLISRKTGVDQVSIEVETIVFYKAGKQARAKEILNTADCFLAPSEYPLKTGEITEEYERPVKIGVLWKNLSLLLSAIEVGVSESESGLMQTLSPGQLKSLGIANGKKKSKP